jgi:hypothetical protein
VSEKPEPPLTNPYRNEVEVDLNGTKYTLRPTFEALAQIEGKVNKSIWEILAAVSSGTLRMEHAAFILETGILAAGKEVDAAFKRNLGEAGVNMIYAHVSTFLVSATVAGDNAKKN